MPAPFEVPAVEDNPDGWGPTSVPAALEDVPFAPFGKGDRIGKAADWTQSGYNKYQGRNQYPQQGAAVFTFFANEEEASFHLVDNRPVKTAAQKFGGPKRFGQRNQQTQQQRREQAQRGQAEPVKTVAPPRGPGNQQRPFFFRDQQRQTQYSYSVEVKPEWAIQDQIPFTALAKLSCSVGEPTDLVTAGEVALYDKAFDRVTVKSEKTLERSGRVFRSVTTSQDPVIQRLAKAGAARIFATDRILTTLMCVRSSVYSWDLVITRKGDQLFFDKRDGSRLDLLTTHETAPEGIAEDKDNINGVQQLSLETTAVNQNFSQQVLVKGGERVSVGEPSPFPAAPGEELASAAYRYRRWTLNADEGLDIVVRCELDAMLEIKGERQLVLVKALNEFDPKVTDWRKRVESQRGAVLATETKNNKNKIAGWTAAALLAGADCMKLGYVSRVSPKSNASHVILGTQICKPREFAAQINLSMDHCWGIVRALAEAMLKMADGTYLLMKDPNKELLRLYSLPEGALAADNYADEGK